jgi:hypothetical protein
MLRPASLPAVSNTLRTAGTEACRDGHDFLTIQIGRWGHVKVAIDKLITRAAFRQGMVIFNWQSFG